MLPLHFLFTNTAEYQDFWVYREVSSCSFKLKLISTLHLQDNVHVQLLSLGRQDSCVISGKRWRERVHQRKVMPTFCFSRVMLYKHVLSRFSTIRLFATPWTVVYQAPLSMGFSRQEYWSGLSWPSPGDLPDPGNDPGHLFSPSLAGWFFSTSATWEAQWKWIALSCLTLCATPWTVAHQDP